MTSKPEKRWPERSELREIEYTDEWFTIKSSVGDVSVNHAVIQRVYHNMKALREKSDSKD